MKVRELIQQLSQMNPETEVSLAIFYPDDSGDREFYTCDSAMEYNDGHPDEHFVQIQGSEI